MDVEEFACEYCGKKFTNTADGFAHLDICQALKDRNASQKKQPDDVKDWLRARQPNTHVIVEHESHGIIVLKDFKTKEAFILSGL